MAEHDRTPVLSPAEISAVHEIARGLDEHYKAFFTVLEEVRGEIADIKNTQSEAEKTSDALIKLPRKLNIWRAVAAVAVTIAGGGAYSVHKAEEYVDNYEQQIRDQALADRDRHDFELQMAEHMKQASDLPKALDPLLTRIENLEIKLDEIDKRLAARETKHR